jgi:phosphonoacetaldehyde hydrolase
MTKIDPAGEEKSIRLAVFDWAGTTVDYGCQAPVYAFVECFKRQGIDISMEEARLPMGMEKRDHIRAVAKQGNVRSAWYKVHGSAISEGDIDKMYNLFASLLLSSIERQSDLVPDVIMVVDELRAQNILIGATTGYFREAAEVVAVKAATLGYSPDFTTNSSEVPAGRPEPWMIYRVMEALHVYPPQTVVNIGDTPVDVQSGINAGVWTVGIAATGNQMGLTEIECQALPESEYASRLCKARASLREAGAHYVIDTLQQLPEVIKDINDRLVAGSSSFLIP